MNEYLPNAPYIEVPAVPSERSPEEIRSHAAREAFDQAVPLASAEAHAAAANRLYRPFYERRGYEDIEERVAEKARDFIEDEQDNRADFAHRLAHTSVPTEELPDYIAAIRDTTHNISPRDEPFSTAKAAHLLEFYSTTEMAALSKGLSDIWRRRYIDGVDGTTALQRQSDCMDVLIALARDGHPQESDEAVQPDKIALLFEATVEAYDQAYTIDRQADEQLFTVFTNAVQTLRSASHNPERIRAYTRMFATIKDRPNVQAVEHLLYATGEYATSRPITSESIAGWTQKLLPALEAHDPQVAVLSRHEQVSAANTDGTTFGAGDFICHAYGSPITPENVHKLTMINRDIPTSNLTKWEQNRRDGLTLGQSFGALRDYIHDQTGDVHSLVRAMIRYHETGDPASVEPFVEQISPALLDRAAYDTPVPEYQTSGTTTASEIKPIDVLRRLEANTRAVEETPPETNDTKLNSLLGRLHGAHRLEKWDALQEAVGYFNDRLKTGMRLNEIGLEPREVETAAWLEQQNTLALQHLAYEDQLHAYRQPWLHAILEFQELTASTKPFDQSEFSRFIADVSGQRDFQEAYRRIARRTLGTINDMAAAYKAAGHDNWAKSLWSANTMRQLSGLTDLKPAETAVGRRHRRERETPYQYRNTGD